MYITHINQPATVPCPSEATLISRYLNDRNFRAQSLSAAGTIIAIDNEVRAMENGMMQRIQYPIVRFTTHDGVRIEFRSPEGTSSCCARIGEGVTVLYHFRNPQNAHLSQSSLL